MNNFFDDFEPDYENDLFYKTAATFKIKMPPTTYTKRWAELILLSQELEESFKKLTELLRLPVKNIDSSSLNKLNEALKKNKRITEKEFNNLKLVIEARNYLNHSFYLNEYRAGNPEITERTLNFFRYAICEASDFIQNRLDQIRSEKTAAYASVRPNNIEEK